MTSDRGIGPVAVADDVIGRFVPGEGLGDLSGDPFRRWIGRHREGYQPPALMPEDDQNEEQPEADRRHNQKVHGGDARCMITRPGKPTDNAFIEARFRAECLNAHWFMSLEDARQKMEAWRRYYNEERPHGAIGQKVPITLLARDGTASPPS